MSAPPASHLNASAAAQSSETGNNAANTSATSAHPPPNAPDPTTTSSTSSTTTPHNATASTGLPSTTPTSPAELTRLKVKLKASLRQYPDFPTPGILFEDIMPLFSDPRLHSDLITALELQIADRFPGAAAPDVVVGLESRGFLFGPTLALRLGAGFVPVRKQGKLPGECLTEGYQKEYGTDFFQMQADAIRKGQKVLIVDDIIATGGSAAAAGNLVQKLGGSLLGYIFIMELDFLKGRDKLNAPVHTLLSGQEEGLNNQA